MTPAEPIQAPVSGPWGGAENGASLPRPQAPPNGAPTGLDPGLLLLGNDRLDRGDGAVGKLDLDHEGADFAQRLLEPDAFFLDPQVAGLAQGVDDLLGADRAEQLAVLAGPLVDRQHRLAEQAGGLGFALGPGLLRLFGDLAAALGLLERPRGRRLRQLAGDQVVAQVAGGDVYRLAALAERLHVLEQDGLCHQRSPT